MTSTPKPCTIALRQKLLSVLSFKASVLMHGGFFVCASRLPWQCQPGIANHGGQAQLVFDDRAIGPLLLAIVPHDACSKGLSDL